MGPLGPAVSENWLLSTGMPVLVVKVFLSMILCRILIIYKTLSNLL